jgi:hypothetical protein
VLVYAARGDLLSPIIFYFHGIVPTWVRKELPELIFVPTRVRYDKQLKLTATHILPTNATHFRFAGGTAGSVKSLTPCYKQRQKRVATVDVQSVSRIFPNIP